MSLSIHDNHLVSYEVRCKERLIVLHTEYDYKSFPFEATDVVFSGDKATNLKTMLLATLSMG